MRITLILIINNQTRVFITNQGILEMDDFLGGLQKSIIITNNIKKV